MACGTPVITSNVSSLPEVCGDAAVLVDPMNITAIVDAVLQIYDNPIFRLNLVKRGLERTKLFSWETTAEKVAFVYEQIII